MITATIEQALFVFTTIGMLMIGLVWIYFDIRERRLYSIKRELHAFHCVKCGHIYGVRQSRAISSCPKCGFRNSKLSF